MAKQDRAIGEQSASPKEAQEPTSRRRRAALSSDPLAWLDNEEPTPAAADKDACELVLEKDDDGFGFFETQETFENEGQEQPDHESEPAEALQLGSSLRTVDLPTLHAQLTDQLERGQPISLDAGDVVELDTCGVQMLYAFAREAESRNLPLTWSSASEAVRTAAHRAGFADLLPAASD